MRAAAEGNRMNRLKKTLTLWVWLLSFALFVPWAAIATSTQQEGDKAQDKTQTDTTKKKSTNKKDKTSDDTADKKERSNDKNETPPPPTTTKTHTHTAP